LEEEEKIEVSALEEETKVNSSKFEEEENKTEIGKVEEKKGRVDNGAQINVLKVEIKNISYTFFRIMRYKFQFALIPFQNRLMHWVINLNFEISIFSKFIQLIRKLVMLNCGKRKMCVYGEI
jgi:hypothetical protein